MQTTSEKTIVIGSAILGIVAFLWLRKGNTGSTVIQAGTNTGTSVVSSELVKPLDRTFDLKFGGDESQYWDNTNYRQVITSNGGSSGTGIKFGPFSFGGSGSSNNVTQTTTEDIKKGSKANIYSVDVSLKNATNDDFTVLNNLLNNIVGTQKERAVNSNNKDSVKTVSTGGQLVG